MFRAGARIVTCRLIHSDSCTKLMKRKKSDNALKEARQNLFVFPTVRLFLRQIETNLITNEKMLSNSRLFLSLLNSIVRK